MDKKVKIVRNKKDYVMMPVKVDVIDYDETVGTRFEGIIDDIDQSIDVERFIRSISLPEIEVLLFRYLGYSSKEIFKIMRLKNMSTYYQISRKLNRSYEYFYKNKEKEV
jgi:hypothetical protein